MQHFLLSSESGSLKRVQKTNQTDIIISQYLLIFFPLIMLFSNTGIVGSRSGANRSCPGAVVTNFDKHCHLLGTPQQCSFQPPIPASEDVSPCSREPLVLRAWKLFWYSPKPRPIGLITLEKQSFVFSGELRMEGLWFPYVSSLMLRNPVRVGFAQFFFFFFHCLVHFATYKWQ